MLALRPDLRAWQLQPASPQQLAVAHK